MKFALLCALSIALLASPSQASGFLRRLQDDQLNSWLCYSHDVAYDGDLIATVQSVETAVECQSLCAENSDCTFFNFSPPVQACDLKKDQRGEVPQSGTVTGPDVCWNDPSYMHATIMDFGSFLSRWFMDLVGFGDDPDVEVVIISTVWGDEADMNQPEAVEMNEITNVQTSQPSADIRIPEQVEEGRDSGMLASGTAAQDPESQSDASLPTADGSSLVSPTPSNEEVIQPENTDVVSTAVSSDSSAIAVQ